MKILAYILALSVLSVFVAAETNNFNLSINTTYSNNTVTISSEGFSVTYALTNQSNSSSHLVNFSRTYNVTITNITGCNQETLNDIKSKVDRLSNSGDYFENYVSCFGNLSGSQARLSECQNKPTYKTEYDACQSTLLQANSQRDAKDLVISSLENQSGTWKATYEEERGKTATLLDENNSLRNQRWFPFAVFACVIGFALAWWNYVGSKRVKERKDDMPQHPMA